MSMQLYSSVSNHISRYITESYSTSFTFGIKALGKKYHQPIYSIYGFVRLADEIVDTFHNYPQSLLLQQFVQQTWQAINEKISTNPVLQSFQEVVNEYHIDHELIKAFLHSMEMDLHYKSHDPQTIHEYIYGSAMVVGLMCLRVFYPNDDTMYQKLKPAALKLGEAFQKVNFLRDIGSDYKQLGRTYFPEIDFNNFSRSDLNKVIASIEADFKEAHKGIQLLHDDVRLGVFVAYCYYQELLKKIRKTNPDIIFAQRIRVNNLHKLSIALTSWMSYKLKLV